MPELHSCSRPAWSLSAGSVHPVLIHSGPMHAGPLPVTSPSLPLFAAAHTAVRTDVLYLLPLVRRQLVANGQQKTRIRFLQFAARRDDLVDLSQMAESFGVSALISGCIASSAFSRLACRSISFSRCSSMMPSIALR